LTYWTSSLWAEDTPWIYSLRLLSSNDLERAGDENKIKVIQRQRIKNRNFFKIIRGFSPETPWCK
jgi:hypothetical protein